MRRLALSILTLLISTASWAQFTTVTAQITDPNNVPYQNCTYSVSFIGQSSQPGPYLLLGSVFQTNHAGARCDSFGNLSVTLADNNAVTPTPSKWEFDFCDQTGKYCNAGGSAVITITGTSQIISASLHAVAPLLPSTATGNGTVNFGTTPCAAYYAASINAVSPICDLMFPGGGIGQFASGLNIGSPNQSVKGTATNVAVVGLSTGSVNPTVGWATFRFLVGGMYCSVNGAAEILCGGGGTNPGGALKSFQFNNTTFGGAVGFNYTAGAGINPGQVGADNINNVITVTPDYNFTACPSGPPTCTSTINPTTISAGANTITLTPCPLGVAGTDTNHNINLTGSGFTEWTPITGGTCTSGAASGTITFTSWGAHTSATISSSSTGIQEADNFAKAQPSSLAFPGHVTKLVAGAAYTCSAPITIYGNITTFDGQWATIQHATLGNCLIFTPGESLDAFDFSMVPTQGYWSVSPSAPSTVPGSSPTATFTIPTGPAGFYSFPGQLLWLAGASGGVPIQNSLGQTTSPNGYGEYVTTTGGTCTPGLSNCTISVTLTFSWATNLSAHGTGYTLSSGVGGYIENAMFVNGHFHDLNFHSNGVSNSAGNLIQIDNDQATTIDSVNMDAGFLTRKDIDFQSTCIYGPGNSGTNSGIVYIHGMNCSEPSSCIKWFNGNDLSWDSGVCQKYTAGGALVGVGYGGFGQLTFGPNVHFETGGLASPWGVCLGNPAIQSFILNKPLINYSLIDQNSFQGGQVAHWCIYLSLAAQTATQYYYLVVHNNTASGCTSGGDCVSIPIPIGAAVVNDPSANNVTLTFFGYGKQGSNNAAFGMPTSYDLLRVTSNSGSVNINLPQAPIGAGTVAVATGLLPSNICDQHLICTIVDNVAPGSLASYTPVTSSASNKRYNAASYMMPGVIALSGGADVNSTGIEGYYEGTPNCINATEFLGTSYIAEFTSHSVMSQNDINVNCPWLISQVASLGPAKRCVSAASPAVCGTAPGGIVAIAPSGTSLIVNTNFVTNYSTFAITEDSTLSTALGVTCDTATGRTYSISATAPGTSFTVKPSSAPTNSACLRFRVINTP